MDKSANQCFVQVRLIDLCISLLTGEIDAFSFPSIPLDLFNILTRREC